MPYKNNSGTTINHTYIPPLNWDCGDIQSQNFLFHFQVSKSAYTSYLDEW
jgi:hypothetical protein